MKPPKRLNPIQVAASAAGAVLAAVFASFFGVSGTIIGTAIGSIVATTVSAIVWESIERGHDAVRQVVVKDRAPLLHRGATESAGEVTGAGAEASGVEAQVDAGLDTHVATGAPADGKGAAVASGEAQPDTAAAGQAEVRQQSPLDPTRQEQMGTAAATGAAGPAPRVTGPRRLVASSRSGRPADVRRTATAPESSRRGRRIGPFPRRWVMVAGSIVGVFVVALGIVTVVEVIVGKPLASITGASKTSGGTTAGLMFGASPVTTTTTTTSTTTTSSTAPKSTTTTSTTSPSSTTTATTTTTPSTSSTTTTTTTTPSAGGTPTSSGSVGPAADGTS